MSTFQQRRCSHCQTRYSYQMSGYGGMQEYNDGTYCPPCYRFIQEALKVVPQRVTHEWVGTTDVSVESLVEQEQKALDAAKAEGKVPVRRVLAPLFDMTRPSNQHMQGIVCRDGRTYRYEYWTEQGGMAAGRVYIEVERDVEEGRINGPWKLTDQWKAPPTFIEHPDWPERPPATHEFVPKPIQMMQPRRFDIIENQSLKNIGDIKFPSRPGHIDFNKIARSLFVVQELPQGALPIYDKDPDITAVVTGDTDDEEG